MISRSHLLLAFGLFACGDSHVRQITGGGPTATPPAGSAFAASLGNLDPTVPLQIESLGTQVRSSRAWTTAIAPNARGGWNFITQTHEAKSDLPAEFVVVDLATGGYSLYQSEPKAYASIKYTHAKQLRAKNGRIFFPQYDVRMSYYDPTDEKVKGMGRVIDPPGDNTFLYSVVFGPDGKLYAGTQSNARPTVVQIDPDTLQKRVIGEVGSPRTSYSYAYQIAIDPPWIYAAVGQKPWELVALNIQTGESRVLATRADNGWMALVIQPDGILAELVDHGRTPQAKKDLVWCVDGKIVPQGTSFKHRNVQPLAAPLTDVPELDVTNITPDHRAVGHVAWRGKGQPDWKQVEFRVQFASPIDIESLTALSDGTVLGNTKSYHGYFRFDPRTNASQFWGPHGPSRAATAWLGNKLYIAGYPNGVLYAYDPASAFTSKHPNLNPKAGTNPLWLGTFAESRAKYATALVVLGNRLYFAGKRERDGIGAGVGMYDPATARFAGHSNDLEWLEPESLVTVDGKLVLSGRLTRTAAPGTTAQLVVYDPQLKELDRQIVRPGMTDTGELFALPDGTVVGVVASERSVYHHDLRKRQQLATKTLDGAISAVTQAPDGSIWLVVDKRLARLDPTTLEPTLFGTSELPANASLLTWQGEDLYMAVRADLWRIRRVGQP